MAPNRTKRHLRIEGNTESFSYQYPGRRPVSKDPKEQNRAIHGNRILQQLEAIRRQFALAADVELPEGIVRDDVIYVEFTSEWGYVLKFDSLDQDRQNASYQILNIHEETRVGADNQYEFRYTVTMVMTQGAVSQFITKAEQYLTENGRYRGVETDNPKNYALINNINAIKVATLESFWTDEPEIPFPGRDEDVWWEVWFRRTRDDDSQIDRVLRNLIAVDVKIGLSELTFAEHKVRLVRGTSAQLAQSLLLLDSLAELRKPQEIADFFHHGKVTREDDETWLADLVRRTDTDLDDDNKVLVCLLDSGDLLPLNWTAVK